MTNDTEQRYALHEAEAELERRKCASQGHDWVFPQMRLMDETPTRVMCRRCGWSGSVTMGPRP